jgi:alcohol dehydrogenase
MLVYVIVVVAAVLVGKRVCVVPSLMDWPSAGKSKDETMTALAYDRHGDVDVLKLRDDIPRPVPREDQILVQVKASSINPVDFKYRRNEVPDFILPKPKIPGFDLAGIVVAAGSKVTKFQVGDRVAAMMPLLGSPWGASAEYSAVKESYACKVGESLDFESAASLPLAALTAVQKLQKIPEPKGKKILIHAGAGGVGSIAIQYAKNVLGMYVATTASGPKTEFLKSLGADVVIDYREQDFVKGIQGYDAVLDTMSFLYEERTLNSDSGVLKNDGIYLNVLSSDWSLVDGMEKANGPISFKNLVKHKLKNIFKPGSIPQYDFGYVYPDGPLLQYIVDLVEQGKLRAIIDSVYDLADAAEAYTKLESGSVTGKVVLHH